MSTNHFPTSDIADEVAQSLGLKKQDGGKPAAKKETKTPKVDKQQSSDLADEVANSLGVKKKDGGNETDQSGSESLGTASPSLTPSPVEYDKAFQSLQDKQLTPQSLEVLANSDFGKSNGLNNIPKELIPAFIQGNNGTKRSDLYHDVVNNVFNTFYPKTTDSQQNKMREKIMQDVTLGNEKDILKVKNAVNQEINNQISSIQNQAGNMFMGQRAPSVKVLSEENQKRIAVLKKQQEAANSAMDNWLMDSIVNSPEIKPFVEMDKNHPQVLTSIAASHIGKKIQETIGLDNPSGNIEYERSKAGMALYINNLGMEVNELFHKGIPSQNPDALKQAQEKIGEINRNREWYNNLDTEQFPDVGIAKTQRFIGDIIAKNNIGTKWFITKDNVREAANIAEQENPGWLNKYGKFLGTVEDNTGSIPHPGFPGALYRGSAKAAMDLQGFLSSLPGPSEKFGVTSALETGLQRSPATKGTALSGASPNKIIFDKDNKAYREVENEHYGKIDWNNITRFAGESLPGLAAWIVPETAAEKATVELGKTASKVLGLVAASYVTQFDSNHKIASELLGDSPEWQKAIYSHMATMTTAAAFELFGTSPGQAAMEAISKGAMKDALPIFEKNGWEKWTQDETANFLKDSVIPRVKAVLTKAGENIVGGAKLGAATVTDSTIKQIAGKIINPDKAANFDPVESIKEFTSQVLLMSMVGIPGMVKEGFKSPSTNDALYAAGTVAPQYIERVNGMVDRGEIDRVKGDEMIAMLKTMGEEVNKAQFEKNDDGLPLTTDQKKKIAIANFRQRAAEHLQELGVVDKVTNESAGEVKEIKKENLNQSIEDSPVFKSITEDVTGEKPKSLSDIDPAKNYAYDKDGQFAVADGAEIINHIQTTKLYEEGNKSAEGQTKETKTAEDKAKDAANKEAEIGKYDFIDYADVRGYKSAGDYLNKLETEGKIQIKC